MGIVNNFFTKRTGFGVLMVISTITLSGSAAYYSVIGLSSLFAGAKTEVIIMASALEFSKLIVASYLHNNWSKIGILLKGYLTTGVVILMLITSAGIYGFLTSAYQITSDQLTIMDKQIAVVDLKKGRFQESLDDYKLEKIQLNESISELSKGLSNNTIQYKDKETGEIITTTSSSTRRVLQAQLKESKSQRLIVSTKMESLNDSITKLDIQVLDMESNNDVAAEVGPLRYLSKITGKSMDVIVNWFTLLIVFVFDPLAVAMVIAINKYFGNTTPPNPIRDEDEDVDEDEDTDEFDEDHALDMVLNGMVDDMTDDEIAELIDNTQDEVEVVTDVVTPNKPDTVYGGLSRKYNDSLGTQGDGGNKS